MNLFLEFDALIEILETHHLRYAVIGGMAVALHGYVRATKDIDILLHPEDLEDLIESMKTLGYSQPSDPWTFKESLLTLWRFVKTVHTDLYMIDVLVGKTPSSVEMIERAVRLPLLNKKVCVANRQDLALLKMARGTAQDLADLERLNSQEEASE